MSLRLARRIRPVQLVGGPPSWTPTTLGTKLKIWSQPSTVSAGDYLASVGTLGAGGLGVSDFAAVVAPYKDKSPFTAQDVRFTTKGETLYAIVLAWPGTGAEVVINSLRSGETVRPIAKVELVASGETLAFQQTPEALRGRFPANPTGEHAYALRVQFQP